jgi:hypothetical protein
MASERPSFHSLTKPIVENSTPTKSKKMAVSVTLRTRNSTQPTCRVSATNLIGNRSLRELRLLGTVYSSSCNKKGAYNGFELENNAHGGVVKGLFLLSSRLCRSLSQIKIDVLGLHGSWWLREQSGFRFQSCPGLSACGRQAASGVFRQAQFSSVVQSEVAQANQNRQNRDQKT